LTEEVGAEIGIKTRIILVRIEAAASRPPLAVRDASAAFAPLIRPIAANETSIKGSLFIIAPPVVAGASSILGGQKKSIRLAVPLHNNFIISGLVVI
jgi:hypothetical protein